MAKAPADTGPAGSVGNDLPPAPDTGPEEWVCVGVTPPESAWAASPGPLLPPPPEEEEGSEDPPEPPEPEPEPAVGEPAPVFQLTDFQPQSCGYEATYGLDLYQDRVTVAVLLAAW